MTNLTNFYDSRQSTPAASSLASLQEAVRSVYQWEQHTACSSPWQRDGIHVQIL